MYEFLTHGFDPVYDKNSKILILGSFPSVKSREQGFYYGHPRNRFWLVLSALFESETPETIEEKRNFLLINRIAVFDVIKSCEIENSSDSSIRNVVPNDIKSIINNSQIKKVFANGKTAAALYEKHILCPEIPKAEALPSTSPANAAYSLERLTQKWKVIKED